MRKNQIISFFGLFIFCIMIGCSSGTCECADCYANVDQTAVKAEIAKTNAAMVESMMSQDVEGFMDYYSKDAVSLPPGRTLDENKAAIRADVEKAWQEPSPPGMTFDIQRADIWVLGDHAVETGSFAFGMEGMDEPMTGKFMTLFHKGEDGKYRSLRDIWNYDSNPDAGGGEKTEIEEM